jgi:hypothetical protein
LGFHIPIPGFQLCTPYILIGSEGTVGIADESWTARSRTRTYPGADLVLEFDL